MESQFKKDLNLQIHLHISADRILDSVHKFLLNETTLDLREKNGVS